MKIAIHNSPGSFSDFWIEYCQQQKRPYKLVNYYNNDIIFQLSDCDALMWHHHHADYKDVLFAKQLLFSLEQTGKKVFPDFNTSWHFDDKLGQKYLLESIGAPLVPTSVFYDKEEALAWAKNTTYPKVFKLRGGAGAANVRLAKNKKEAVRLIRTDIIKEIGLLDEKTFLYLEELILHEKLRVLNKSTYIVPQSKIVHKGGKTTNIIPSSFIMQTLQESRQYYFRSYRHFSAWFLYIQKFLNNIYFFMKLLKKTIKTKRINNL